MFLLTIGGYCANAAVVLSETHTNVSCYGGNNGSINLTATGTAPYIYVWNDSIMLEDRSGLVAGTYTVIVYDALLSSDTLSITIGQPTQIVAAKAITPVSCGGGNDGAIDLTVSGGTPGYTYQWADGATTEDRINLTAYNYHFTVTDGNGCQMNDSANVTQPMGMVPSTAVTNANCNASNGGIDLTVQYGYPPYSYAWGDGPTTEDRNSLMIGTYTVTITDNIACQVTMSATINQANTPMNINHTATNVACNGGNTGAINITSVVGAPGPFSYSWSNSATTQNISGLTANSYTVTVTSSNSCTATKTINITEPSILIVNTTATQPNCYGANNGAITTSVSGGTSGYTYNWGGGITTQNRFGLGDGTYTVTVTDTRGCTAVSSKTITSPAQVTVVATPTQLNCMGGSTGAVVTTVSGGTGAYSYWWGAGITTANRSGVPAGTYNVTVTDANGCSNTASAVINTYIPMTASHTQVNNNCYGDSIGSINLTVNNGLAPFGFTWSNGAVTEDLSNLKADTYTVTVSDNNGCSITRNANITQPSFPIYLNGTVSDATCGGYNNGSINVSVSGGVSPYTFVWNDAVAAQNRTNLAAGSYSVTLIDNNGCQASNSYTVAAPAPIAIVASTSNAACNGAATGSITLTVTGGNAPYTYSWNDAVTTQNRANIAAGAYQVTVTDNHSCSATASATITQPTALSVAPTVTNVSCNGSATGSIVLNVTGGTGAYSFRWNNAATTQNRSNIAAGNYSVTVTDAANCTAAATATITQPASLTATRTITGVTCYGYNNGAMRINVNGGSAPYTYLWNDGDTAQNRTNLLAGTYNATITDANGCNTTISGTINQPAQVSVTISKTNSTCTTGGNMTVTVATGGIKTYLWSTGSTSATISNLQPGTYTVTARYGNSCTTTISDSIVGIAPITIAYTKVDNTNCPGDTAGSIDITTAGGTAPYTYVWNNGSTNEDRIHLAAGTYRVTATDANSCARATVIQITQPAAFTIANVRTNVSCTSTNDGAINITPNGGTAPYTYIWNNGATTEDISNLTVGTYVVTLTDAHGCTGRSGNLNVTQPSTIVVNETHQNVSCNGGTNGSIDINATGGTGQFRYQWNVGSGTTQRVNLAAASYRVTVTDTISTCATVKIIPVTEPAQLQTLVNITHVSCYGNASGAVSFSPFGGTAPYTYTWNNGASSQTISNLVAGTYNVTITDSNACSITATANVQQAGALQPTIAAENTCNEINNGSVALSINGGTGGYTYTWSNGDTTQSIGSLSDGTYTVTVKDAANCEAIASGTVNRLNAININEAHNNITCFGAATGAIQVSPQGGSGIYNFAWSNGTNNNLQNNIAAGSYTVSVNDTRGCVAQKTIVLTQPSQLILSEQHTNYACSSNPGNIDVTISGGTPPYFYRWNDNVSSEDRSALATGSYVITVTDYNSCTSTLPVNITSASAMSLTTAVVEPTCHGYNNGAITTSITGGTPPYNYLWTNGSTNRDMSSAVAGTYAILITDANNCSVTQAVSVTQPSGVTISPAIAHVLCHGAATGKIELNTTSGTAPYTYVWNNGSTNSDQINIHAGEYAVTVTDAANCSTIFNGIDVNQPNKIDIQANITPSGCFANSAHGAIDVTVSGGTAPMHYSWDNGTTSQDLNNLVAGNYFLAVTDANGCLATKANTVALSPAIDVTATVKNSACSQVNNGVIELAIAGGVPGFTVAWSNGDVSENLNNLAAGTYTVTVTDMSHCSAVANYTVATDYELTVQAATNIESLVSGQAAELTATTNVDNHNAYTWSSTQDVNCSLCATTAIKPLATAAYTVSVIDANGCSATDMVTVEVKDIKEIFIPNAFTPNNDANNDLFKVYGDMSTIAMLDIKIFNRWGEKVYETNDIEFAWDGTYKGEYVDRGVYTYTLKIVYVNGVSNDLYTGSITVLR